MRPVETILGMRGGGLKENNGGGEFKADISDIRAFVNATMYPSTTIKIDFIFLKVGVSTY
jgi:hypothetical protein